MRNLFTAGRPLRRMAGKAYFKTDGCRRMSLPVRPPEEGTQPKIIEEENL